MAKSDVKYLNPVDIELKTIINIVDLKKMGLSISTIKTQNFY